MGDVKIYDNDILKLLNLYKQENSVLKSQNESLRKENVSAKIRSEMILWEKLK